MLMSIFSSFDAFSAESLGQKVGFSWPPSKGAKVVVDSPSVDRKGAKPVHDSVKPDKIGSSTEPPADVNRSRREQKPQRRPRFAPELDGVYCFETIVPY